MKEFKEFYKKGIGAIRAIEEGGEIWFNSFDVLVALGETDRNAAAILDSVDDDDKRIVDVPCDWEDRTEHVPCVNKCGLYTMLLAENFSKERNVWGIKKWVADEIIPAMVGASFQ